MEEIAKMLQILFNGIGLTFFAQHINLVIAVMTSLLFPFMVAAWKTSRWIYKHYQQYLLAKDLHPFYTRLDLKNATDFYVPTKCQNISPSKENEPDETNAFATKEKIIPFLKRAFKTEKGNYRFFIILADSGMGKTTFMINFYLNYVSQLFGKAYSIKLIPLGHPEFETELDNIPNEKKERTILLLDGFDEDKRAIRDYKARMEEIIGEVWRFREVVITSRTQFFPNEDEEPRETGIPRYGGDKGEFIFHKLYVSPFDEKDIKKYISHKFSIFHMKKRKKAWRIIHKSPHLMVRPMLLSWIDDLLEGEVEYEFDYLIYRDLIDKWIERESKSVLPNKRVAFRKELYDFSIAIARDIYRNFSERGGLYIGGEDINPFAKNHGITLDDITLKSRSLLTRNAQHQYKFAHKSILEYLLAFEASKDSAFKRELSFDGMDRAQNFYENIVLDKWMSFLKKYNVWGIFEYSRKIIPISEINLIGSLEKLEKIESLSMRGNGIDDFSYFEQLAGLKELDLSNNQITSITRLKELKSLKELTSIDLSNNFINDFSALKELTFLKKLDLSNNQITDISTLNGLEGLEELQLNDNQIMDISALKDLKGLGHINLRHNQIEDISVLKELKDLKYVNLRNNQITDISTLNGLEKLKELQLNNNQITDISKLKELKGLDYLDLRFNQITDISTLKELKGVDYLDLRFNQITDISTLKELKGVVF